MNDACNCFNFVPYALGSGGKLNRFSSITFNKYSKGIKIFVPKLKGYRLPDGSIHNGCLRVDDTCFDCDESRIKLYVEDVENSEELKKSLANIVDIEPYSSCEPLTY
ncbi:hypothetical protein CONCODRAFT_10445 [Conidiobolus coronatus NRRL 28638]|uniref:Uncharacterized protein n=1 Tax=Conidiobolus coronatus (strain ATCC 28846 / CBS 209.66 / NRRL 28638) TaxID=796925 RepID=A0A137NXB2_CONC2|nr:hypothetical protein CONCODRAFT_10445 [Conidiobolus coronatus NRRL 28638]|eukprot:KXN67473.1 hypothetical protein CONCODRAFT_10445 [Conidiobolus coronatus NRRL 28638]